MLRSPGSRRATCRSCTRWRRILQRMLKPTARSTTPRSPAPGRCSSSATATPASESLDRDRQRVRDLEQPRHPVPAGRLLLQAREPPRDRPQVPARSRQRLRAALDAVYPALKAHSPTSRSAPTPRARVRSDPLLPLTTTSSRPGPRAGLLRLSPLSHARLGYAAAECLDSTWSYQVFEDWDDQLKSMRRPHGSARPPTSRSTSPSTTTTPRRVRQHDRCGTDSSSSRHAATAPTPGKRYVLLGHLRGSNTGGAIGRQRPRPVPDQPGPRPAAHEAVQGLHRALNTVTSSDRALDRTPCRSAHHPDLQARRVPRHAAAARTTRSCSSTRTSRPRTPPR